VAGMAFVILTVSLVIATMDRRAKGALRRQEILLDTALENMSQGLCMFDPDGRILLFNERYMTMMERTGVQLRGRLVLDVLLELQAAGRWEGDVESTFADLMVEMRAGRAASQVIRQFGRSIRIVDQPTEGGGWVATYEDITDWERTQQQISHMARHD